VSSRGASAGAGDEGSAAPSGRVHRIEIVHESLLRAWPRLVRWQAQDDEGAVLRDQLKQAANLWVEKGRPDDLLWTGTSEREFELWHDRYPGKLTALEESYAIAMVGRTRRRRRWRRVAGAGVVAASLAVAAVVGVSRQQAVDQARRAESAQLLALAEARLEDDPTEALAYATTSLGVADTHAARLFVLKALAEAPPAREVATDGISARSPAFSPDGKLLAVAGHGSEAGVWTDEGTGPLRLGGLTPNPNCSNTALWPSESLLVTGMACGLGDRAFVWSLPGGEKLRSIDLGRPSAWSVGPGQLLVETPDSTGRTLSFRSWRLPDAGPETLGTIDVSELGATRDNEKAIGTFAPDGHGWLYAKGRDVVRLPLPVGRDSGTRVSQHPADVVTLEASPRASDGPFSIDRSREIHVYPATDGPHATVVLPKLAGVPDGATPAASGRWVVGPTWAEKEARLWDPRAPPGARALRLRRSGSWYAAGWDIHPTGDWLVATTSDWTRLTFWPLRQPRPVVIDGYESFYRPMAFSTDGRWLASAWSDGALRLWPIPGTGVRGVRHLTLPAEMNLVGALAFAPDDRFLVAAGQAGRVYVVPLDGERPRELEGFPEDVLVTAALSPSGRRVAAAAGYGSVHKEMRVWDLESGEVAVYELPSPPLDHPDSGDPPERTGYEAGVQSLAFGDEWTLYTAGDGGVRRWDLRTRSSETVIPTDWGVMSVMALSDDGRRAITQGYAFGRSEEWVAERRGQMQARIWDLVTLAPRHPTGFPEEAFMWPLEIAGRLFAAGDREGVLRVGSLDEPEALRVLAGHEGPLSRVAISPDGHWIASTGQDNTLRLWPMPDFDRPPLHTLPHDELLAKLKTLTNLRAVRSPDSATGWTIELAPFPGWKDVPTW